MGRNAVLPVPVLKADLRDKATPLPPPVVLPLSGLPSGKQKPGAARGRCQPESHRARTKQPSFWACEPRKGWE